MKSVQPKKSSKEIDNMRQCGQMLATVLAGIKKIAKVGVSEVEVDEWVGKEIKSLGAIATYKTKEVNFPANICISTNQQIVHSIPTDYRFNRSDIVSFDLVIEYGGMKTDSAFTMMIGEKPSGDKKRLLDVTEASLYAGIEAINGSGIRVGDISSVIEKVLKKGNLGIIRELVGHGIGQKMQQDPEVPNYGRSGTGTKLFSGDTIAIEPMATLGGETILVEPGGWTISTRDGSLAAHFEHTVMITDSGYEILTKL